MSVWFGWLLCLALTEDPSFSEGQRLYRAFEYEQAIFRFQEVAVRPQLPTEDRAEALVWLGLAYAGTGDLDAARRNFKDALTLHPTAALPANASPRVKELFDEVAAELGPARAATGTATTTPPPADPVAPPPTDPAALPQETTPEPAAGGAASALLVPGAVVAGVGAAALVAGVVLAVLASSSYADATDPNAFQDDAKAALDRASAEAIAAGVALPLGALLAGGGVAMIAVSMLSE